MLLENDNKKFIRTLSNNCLKANKIRNAIALLAIMLTALLFTAVATILQGTQISVREQTIRQSGTRFMASIKFTTAEKTKELMEDPLWENVSVERVLWKIVNQELMDISVNMAWMEETETKVNLQYLTDEGVKEETMTLSGYWEGEKYEQTAEVMVSEAFLEKRIDESTIAHDASVPGSYCIRGSFATDEDVEGQLNTVIANAGFDPDAERGEEGFVGHHTNPAYENRNEMGGGMIAAAVFWSADDPPGRLSYYLQHISHFYTERYSAVRSAQNDRYLAEAAEIYGKAAGISSGAGRDSGRAYLRLASWKCTSAPYHGKYNSGRVCIYHAPSRCVGGVGSLYLSYRVDQLRPPRKAGSQSISCGSAAISGR